MPIQVYGLAMSTCTQRVLTTLVEKGLKYELVNVDLFKGEQKVHRASKNDDFQLNLHVESKIS
jgi:glutathione S-transferase